MHQIDFPIVVPENFFRFRHGLINCTDTKAFVGFSLEIYLQETFPALICHPSRRKCTYGRENSSFQWGQGLLDFRETCSLVSFLLQHSKNYYLFN